MPLPPLPGFIAFFGIDVSNTRTVHCAALQDVAAAADLPPTSSTGVTSSSNGSSSDLAAPAPNIIVFAARYNSGLPYQGPVTVQLREYLPGSRRVAVNEMMVQQRLCGQLPREKWQVGLERIVDGLARQW
jgi:hypothetical protein